MSALTRQARCLHAGSRQSPAAPRLLSRPSFVQSARGVALGVRSPLASRPASASAAGAGKVVCKASAVAAQAVVATSTAVATTLPPEVVLTCVGGVGYTALCLLAIVLFPRQTSRVFKTVWPFVPLALAYLVLLFASWSPDTLHVMMPGSLQEGLAGGFNPQFIPRLEGIMGLFGRMPVTASWILHVAVINLFAARWVLLEGLREGVHTWPSVLLCSVFGPLGVLCHLTIKALTSAVPALRVQEQVVKVVSPSGTITILPYTEEGGSGSGPKR
ncbi:hypothetical protein HYH03_017623 [Edaphochlamys debaryana]|uniref:Uncharacterized protein n=1 Tax=Edaphochlamys debaryana TaxID=47281 RepID=A0A835XJP5_9CHLO|nr:hypothetical protein HYH03_017623 [Edaphochlamys debaryana]|eukprot:KAG2483516.1 hypothetical protein HYH03_017623 [Edaphochlamys debaryana]